MDPPSVIIQANPNVGSSANCFSLSRQASVNSNPEVCLSWGAAVLKSSMDPLSILATVVSTAVSIYTWVDQLEAANDTIQDLRSTLSSITIVLKPLQTRISDGSLPHDPGIFACIQDIGETLARAQDHLERWQASEARKKGDLSKRILAFFDPSSVVGELKEDRDRLDQKISLLALAVQLSSLNGPPSAASSLKPSPSPADLVDSKEVSEFWKQMIGKQAFCCPVQRFCDTLGLWIDQPLPGMAEVLMHRLDEVGYGGITPSSFDRFVGARSIREAVDQLRVPSTAYPVAQSSDIKRIMLWVGLDNQESSMQYAESLGIAVVAFTSAATAKAWIEVNDAMLRETAAAHRLRFVSYNAPGKGATGGPNPTSGESFLRYIRGRQFLSPVLILAGASINTTTYVTHYSRAGSTSDLRILHGYIDGFAKGVRDVEWVGYNTVWGVGLQGSPTSTAGNSLLVRPTLVFVTGGSDPQVNEGMVNYSMTLGITSIVLSTTAELKGWVESNEAQITATAAAHRLRFITQNVRWESGVLNTSAGADTLHYIRTERGLASPVLVYGNSSISTTDFVTRYVRAGSTSDQEMVKGFIGSLALGVRDEDWVGFNVRRGGALAF